ncbi:sulfite exporter TauE/SafE family protein [Planktothrix tepida]|nr:sulfite exporter TauE/SafE family protein [Planktothrix tepida]
MENLLTFFPLSILILVFFLTGIISVVTGCTSLITVPVMLQMGIEPDIAIATNMLALTFLSLGGTIPFIKEKKLNTQRLPSLILLTILGSILGAFLVFTISKNTLSLIISLLMVAIAIFVFLNPETGIKPHPEPASKLSENLGYLGTFLLGIYGGFFSGGYVTLLTASYVMLFHQTFIEAVATTKVINIFSSLVATLIFTAHGIVNYPLGIVLSLTMFMGGILGAKIALNMSNLWIKRLFMVTVLGLALKTFFSALS